MRTPRLVILFIVAILLVSVSCLLALTLSRPLGGLQGLSLGFLAGGVGVLITLGIRVSRFSRRLRGFIRLLLTGNYQVGVTTSSARIDEVSDLDRHLEKLAEQLRTYDDLRARRVYQCQRALDLITENTVQPMIIYDLEHEILECNPAMRSMLDIGTQTVSFNAIEKIPANKAFMAMIRNVVDTEKTMQEGQVYVQFPSKDSGQEMEIRILPLKDKEEVVQMVLILNTTWDTSMPKCSDEMVGE